MTTIIVLICLAGTPQEACTERTAQDVQYIEAPILACGMAAQSALARQAGDRENGMTTRMICGRGKHVGN